MVASPEFASFLCDELSPLGHVTTLPMFGKTGVFCDGVMLGMVNANAFYLRVDDLSREAFKEAESSPSLSYVKGGRTIDLSFWPVPDRVFDDHDELIEWSQAARAAAHRVAAKRRNAARLASATSSPLRRRVA